MSSLRRGFVRGLAVVLLLLSGSMLSPTPGRAGDGLIELNQTCATQTGCVAGDGPGFPITLTTRGSYRLTSDLAVPNQNTDGIKIGADDVTLDFNGFTLFGPAFVPISTHVCTLPGTGTGVSALAPLAPSGFVAQNGRVRGMGAAGILINAPNARIERMIVERNCAVGIFVGTAGLVIDSQSRANVGIGIHVGTGSVVRDSIADNNFSDGINGDSGAVVTGCVASSNRFYGINLDSGATGGVVMGSSAIANGTSGISMGNGMITVNSSASGNASFGVENGAAGSNAFGGNGLGGATFTTIVACNDVNGVKVCP